MQGQQAKTQTETETPLVVGQTSVDEQAWIRADDAELAERLDWDDLEDDRVWVLWLERRWRRRAVKALGWATVVLSIFATLQLGATSPRAREAIGRWATLGAPSKRADLPAEVPARASVTKR